MDEKQPLVAATPRASSTLRTDKELRIELPFDSFHSSIYYAGLNLHENWATPSHTHEHFELCYLDEGRGQYKIDKTVYDFRKGQLLLTKPGENHYGLAGKDAPFKLYYVGFRLEWLSDLQVEIYGMGAQRIAEDRDDTVKSLFVALIEEAQNPSRLAAAMAEALLQQLLIKAIRRCREEGRWNENSVKPLDAAILETMNRLHGEIRYDRDIDALAAAVPMSRSHLTRKFKQTIGIPIGEYIRNLCLSKAKSELRATVKSVSLIAEELGFASIHAFSIFFKRFTGQTPTDYRRNNRIGDGE